MAERMDPMDEHLDEDQIFGLAEGGLDASAHASAEAHLQACAACRRELEAATAYFKEVADLEPVKAPANFLANVRARLPRPSPLRAFLDTFMRPLRVIPMQVALLTILGLTAISSYLYQRGGLEKASSNVISESNPIRPDTIDQSPAPDSESDDQPLEPSAPPHPDASAPSPGVGAPSPKNDSRSPRPLLKQMRPAQAPLDLEDAAASGSGLAGKRAKANAQPESEPGFRSDEALSESDSPMALDRAAPASAPASPKAASPAPRSAPAPASRQTGPPAPIVASKPVPLAEAAREEKPRTAKEEAVKEEAVKEEVEKVVKQKQAEAKDGSSDQAKADTKDMRKSPSSLILGNAAAIGSAELPAYILRLAPGVRIGNVVSGLKAMGADSLSAWTARDSGVISIDYHFLVPASMRKDIAPYLERYGKVEVAGPLPAAGSAPSRIRIRFLP